MKRSHEDSGGAEEDEEDSAGRGDPTATREHLNDALEQTLRSAQLGKGRRCFLCTYTDGSLADGTMFASDSGPIDQVSKLWRHNVDTTDADTLARDCCELLKRLVSEYAPDPASGEANGGESDGARPVCLDDITPDAVKHHFCVCETTKLARLDALKGSFRHVAQLELACARGMYTECAKTGRPRPDAGMAALLLKANAAMLKTNSIINALEGGGR